LQVLTDDGLGQGKGPSLAAGPADGGRRAPAAHLPGDDDTDEAALRAVAGRGIGILVADEPRETAATYGLRDTEAAREWLGRLVEWSNDA